MSKVQTAEELFNKYNMTSENGFKTAIRVAKIYAELHREAALKAASESKAECSAYTEDGLDYKTMILCKESILNAYPKENIQ